MDPEAAFIFLACCGMYTSGIACLLGVLYRNHRLAQRVNPTLDTLWFVGLGVAVFAAFLFEFAIIRTPAP